MSKWSRIAGVVLFLAWGVLPADEIRPEFRMFNDPEMPPAPPVTRSVDDDALRLWLEALRGAEADLQRQAADAIARAHELGAPGMDRATDDLQTLAANPAAHDVARMAACRALVVIDARNAADALAGAAVDGDTEMRMVVEPALADWNYEPVQEIWLKRVHAQLTNRRELRLAVTGLARVGATAALADLLQMVASPGRPPDLRLAAAQAAGEIAHTGLEDAARSLHSRPDEDVPLINRLCAVRLLAHHQSEDARAQLAILGRDAEPSVAAAALGALHAIDPALVLPHVEWALGNPDPLVRQRGIDAYVALPTPERMAALAPHLDDVHPQLRRGVCSSFVDLAAQADLRTQILDSGMTVLHAESWRGQEQASLLFGALAYKPAADRLIELMEGPREEVMVASAWALDKLEVPETLPAIHDRAERYTAAFGTSEFGRYSDIQGAHLFETLGRLLYAPAEPMLRKFVPKTSRHVISRSAAVWALGHLHADNPDPALIKELIERLEDVNSMPPEWEEVRQMCAVSLGRMHAEEALPSFRRFLGPVFGYDPTLMRIRWAQIEITGEDFPLPRVPMYVLSNFFLESLPK